MRTDRSLNLSISSLCALKITLVSSIRGRKDSAIFSASLSMSAFARAKLSYSSAIFSNFSI